jgi:hypothetical protein
LIFATRTASSHLARVILYYLLHFFYERLVLLGTLLGGKLEVTLLRRLENLDHGRSTLLLHALLGGSDGSLALDVTILILNEILLHETTGRVLGGTVENFGARTFGDSVHCFIILLENFPDGVDGFLIFHRNLVSNLFIIENFRAHLGLVTLKRHHGEIDTSHRGCVAVDVWLGVPWRGSTTEP